ncbi:hypothetical protein [Streptomyces narbonensis]
MRAAGHPYATPADARNALPANREDDRAFAAEVRLATGAVCAGSSASPVRGGPWSAGTWTGCAASTATSSTRTHDWSARR